MKRLRMGVVGVGHLGKEHARILSTLPDVELVGVADPHAAQAESVALRCNTRAYPGHLPLVPLVDAAVIAAPTFAHHAIASDFLSRGVPVLVEKPLTVDPAQADELVALAERRGLVLQVGHIERFNPAFEAMQRLPLQPKYIHSERCGGFTGRSTDVGVVHDLMIHDLDLIQALVRSPVRSVEALGAVVLGGCEDLAQARIVFADGCVADVRASRVHPTAARRMQVWAPEGFVGADLARRHAVADAAGGAPAPGPTRLAPARRRRDGVAQGRVVRPASPGARAGVRRRQRPADAGIAGVRELRANGTPAARGRSRGA